MTGQYGHFHVYAPEPIEYAQTRYANEANRLLGVLDRRLAGRAFVAGDEYTIADMAIYPWIRVYDKAPIDMAPYPEVRAGAPSGWLATARATRWRSRSSRRGADERRAEVVVGIGRSGEAVRRDRRRPDRAWPHVPVHL